LIEGVNELPIFLMTFSVDTFSSGSSLGTGVPTRLSSADAVWFIAD